MRHDKFDVIRQRAFVAEKYVGPSPSFFVALNLPSLSSVVWLNISSEDITYRKPLDFQIFP